MSDNRPSIVQPRSRQQLEAVREFTGGGAFDPDVWHVMDERDNRLIAEEVMHGSGSSKFVYSFDISGKEVAGISVIGARHLANKYGGLKHRLITATQKVGDLFTFTTFPSRDTEMRVSCAIISELRDQPDYYSAVIELSDIKTGNSIQVERREMRFEFRRDGSPFERPHYATIAQSKAYRNAILSLLPQDVQLEWKAEMLKLGKDDIITLSVIDQKRDGVMKFAASAGIPLLRHAVEDLTMAQISGLSDAAREGRGPFTSSLAALGLAVLNEEGGGEDRPPAQQQSGGKLAGGKKADAKKPDQGKPADQTKPAADKKPDADKPAQQQDDKKPAPAQDDKKPVAAAGDAGQPKDADPPAGDAGKPPADDELDRRAPPEGDAAPAKSGSAAKNLFTD